VGHDNQFLIDIRKRNGMKIMEVFFDESGTKETGVAVVQYGCLAETGNEYPTRLINDLSICLFQVQNSIDFSMLHITLDIIRGVSGIDVHCYDIFSIVNNTQMTLMILVHGAFVYLAQVQNIHHPDIAGCEYNMARPMVLRKEPLNLLTKFFKILLHIIILKNNLLFVIMAHS
jgi:hypothetical protein